MLNISSTDKRERLLLGWYGSCTGCGKCSITIKVMCCCWSVRVWWRNHEKQMNLKSSRWKSDYFEMHLMPRQPLPHHHHQLDPPPPPLCVCTFHCRETACSHELKINHVTERGQLYRSCITYGSSCYTLFLVLKKRESRVDILLALRQYPPRTWALSFCVSLSAVSWLNWADAWAVQFDEICASELNTCDRYKYVII